MKTSGIIFGEGRENKRWPHSRAIWKANWKYTTPKEFLWNATLTNASSRSRGRRTRKPGHRLCKSDSGRKETRRCEMGFQREDQRWWQHWQVQSTPRSQRLYSNSWGGFLPDHRPYEWLHHSTNVVSYNCSQKTCDHPTGCEKCIPVWRHRCSDIHEATWRQPWWDLQSVQACESVVRSQAVTMNVVSQTVWDLKKNH